MPLKPATKHRLFTEVLSPKNASHVNSDLKPENILLDFDKNLKLCDFGLATFIKDGMSLSLSFFFFKKTILIIVKEK